MMGKTIFPKKSHFIGFPIGFCGGIYRVFFAMAFAVGWRPWPGRHPSMTWLIISWTEENKHVCKVCNCKSNESSDSRQEQTSCQDIATVCIRKSKYLGFGGPWVSAVLALVFNFSPPKFSKYKSPGNFWHLSETLSQFTWDLVLQKFRGA